MTIDDPKPSDDAAPQPAASDAFHRRSATRRQFLAALGASVVVGVAGGYGIAVFGRNGSAAAPTTSTTIGAASSPPPGTVGPETDRVLVVIEMGGGNDGLNTVVPHTSAAYHDLRGDLAIATPLDLDGEVGLHPELGFVADRYALGDVAIVEGIGYPDPDLSHFASMATWWSAYPGSIGHTGWLGRYLDGTVGSDDPLAGVVIGPGPSPAMAGEHAFVVTVQDMTGLTPAVPPWIDHPEELLGMWQGFAPAPFDGAVLLDQVRTAIDRTVDASQRMAAVLDEPVTGPPTQDSPGGRRGDLRSFLEVAAALVVAPSPPKVIYVHGWGDFDTHEGHDVRHGEMMRDLDDALAGFFSSVDAAGMSHRVIVMTTSEFGRRPAYNGSGTDHGTAAAHLVLGAPVAGGRYGQAPSLSRLDRRGNLVHTVDYRSVYASVLSGYLGADAERLLGGRHETLPLFSASPEDPA